MHITVMPVLRNRSLAELMCTEQRQCDKSRKLKQSFIWVFSVRELREVPGQGHFFMHNESKLSQIEVSVEVGLE